MKRSAILPTALVLAAACGTEEPKAATGRISGTVTSAAGTALAGAAVATVPANVAATTDAAGRYLLDNVNAGTCKVVVALAGYVTREREGVVVAAGATTTLDVVLEPATGAVRLTVNDVCGTGGLAGATVKPGTANAVTTGADGSVTIEGLAPGELTLAVSRTEYLPASVSATVVAGGTATKTLDLECQSHVVAEAARAFLATVTAPATSPITTATALHDRMNDTDTTNDPFKVVDVRAAADYAGGHIPGAINIGWKAVADDASLALLGDPAGKTCAANCYTGHTGAIATGVLNLLGFRTANLKFGIVSWTRDAAARGTIAVEPDLSKDFAVETTARTAESNQTPPVLDFDGVITKRDVVKAAAKAYLSDPAMAPTIAAQTLFDNLNDGDTANDPFVISVRKPEDYAKGHIPGAVNIPWNQIASEESLKKIPTGRDIVVYCYTGHTGGIATGVLGTLGYHKVKNLKFGMAGWTQDANVRSQAPFADATDAHDFPVTAGANP